MYLSESILVTLSDRIEWYGLMIGWDGVACVQGIRIRLNRMTRVWARVISDRMGMR